MAIGKFLISPKTQAALDSFAASMGVPNRQTEKFVEYMIFTSEAETDEELLNHLEGFIMTKRRYVEKNYKKNRSVSRLSAKTHVPPAVVEDLPWDFTATSLTPVISYMKHVDDPAPKLFTPPKVIYAEDVWAKIQFAVKTCTEEVGWLGLVDTLPNGDYLITDVYFPPQEVHGTETDISADAVFQLYLQLQSEGKDPGKLSYWGHSHVNMGVTPSAQDELQARRYLRGLNVLIRGIYNKAGAAKVDVFDTNQCVVFQNVTRELITPEPPAWQADLKATLTQNVKKASYLNSVTKKGAADSYTNPHTFL